MSDSKTLSLILNAFEPEIAELNAHLDIARRFSSSFIECPVRCQALLADGCSLQTAGAGGTIGKESTMRVLLNLRSAVKCVLVVTHPEVVALCVLKILYFIVACSKGG